ncbi:MAG: ion transporter [Thermoleophilia bacterium]
MKQVANHQTDREELRDKIDRALDVPMALIAAVALILIIVELATEVTAEWAHVLEITSWLIWSAFAGEFLLKLLLSTRKRLYIRQHWVELLIVAVPFLRIFRILGILRFSRSIAMLRLLLFTQFGAGQLSRILTRRIGYLLAVTALVIFSGAAGGYILETPAEGSRLITFGDSLWWSAGLITTVSTEIFPITTGGRLLAFSLMIYGMVGFSFLAASIASFLIGKQTDDK